MPSGVTIFFDTVFFPTNDPERQPRRAGPTTSRSSSMPAREAVDGLYAKLTDLGHAGAGAVEVDRPVAAIVEDPEEPDPDHRRGCARRDLAHAVAIGPRSPRRGRGRATGGSRSAASTAGAPCSGWGLLAGRARVSASTNERPQLAFIDCAAVPSTRAGGRTRPPPHERARPSSAPAGRRPAVQPELHALRPSRAAHRTSPTTPRAGPPGVSGRARRGQSSPRAVEPGRRTRFRCRP